MFNLVGLALTFGLCPLPLTCPTVNVVHLSEAQTQAPLEAIPPAKNSRWHWNSFHLGTPHAAFRSRFEVRDGRVPYQAAPMCAP